MTSVPCSLAGGFMTTSMAQHHRELSAIHWAIALAFSRPVRPEYQLLLWGQLLFFFFPFPLATSQGLQALSSLIRDQTLSPTVKVSIPNHWTIRKFLVTAPYTHYSCIL